MEKVYILQKKCKIQGKKCANKKSELFMWPQYASIVF